jgi:hypothetical protein
MATIHPFPIPGGQPSPSGELLLLDQLRAGDVLLQSSPDALSRAIRLFDGGEFSHAALYLGDGVVADTASGGLQPTGVESLIAGADRVIVRRLKSNVATMEPVLAQASKMIEHGERYVLEPIVLVAFLCLTRKVRVTPVVRDLVVHVLQTAAVTVERCFVDGSEPLSGSEFVYRCFLHASAGRSPYAIEVNTLPPAGQWGSPSPEWLHGGGRGRGVHADSLLAWRVSSAMRSWSHPIRPKDRPRGAVPLIDHRILLSRYLAEVRSDEPQGSAPDVSDEELLAAIDGFAVELHHGPRRSASAGALAGEIAAWALFDTETHLVTPADLLHSESLFTVGRLI